MVAPFLRVNEDAVIVVASAERLNTARTSVLVEIPVASAAGARPVTGAVRSLHVQEHADGVAEVCATVRRGQRMAAVALRLEGLSGRWTCTELTCV